MTTLTNSTIGFIGLGLMGKPMCHNLHKAGASMTVFNRLELPASKLNMSLYEKLIERGEGNLDHSALIRALENQSD